MKILDIPQSGQTGRDGVAGWGVRANQPGAGHPGEPSHRGAAQPAAGAGHDGPQLADHHRGAAVGVERSGQGDPVGLPAGPVGSAERVPAIREGQLQPGDRRGADGEHAARGAGVRRRTW